MEKKLRDYIVYIETLIAKQEVWDVGEHDKVQRDMLVQIGFFQHERLIHLIVTVTFAILTVGSLIACLLLQMLALYCLTLLLIILLIPYIRHYYILENGVQKLYALYEEMK